MIDQLLTWLTIEKKKIPGEWIEDCKTELKNRPFSSLKCQLAFTCFSKTISVYLWALFENNWSNGVIVYILSWMHALCTILFSQSEFSTILQFELNVLIFASIVLRTMVSIEAKDVFRRSFQTILESPEFGKWPCYSSSKAN